MSSSRTKNAPVAIPDDEQQQEMWPDLDKTNPEHKRLLRLAKSLSKKRAERNELLTTSKQTVDAAEQDVIKQMHKLDMSKFRFGGVTTEIVASKEKVEVKIATEGEEEEDDDAAGDE